MKSTDPYTQLFEVAKTAMEDAMHTSLKLQREWAELMVGVKPQLPAADSLVEPMKTRMAANVAFVESSTSAGLGLLEKQLDANLKALKLVSALPAAKEPTAVNQQLEALRELTNGLVKDNAEAWMETTQRLNQLVLDWVPTEAVATPAKAEKPATPAKRTVRTSKAKK